MAHQVTAVRMGIDTHQEPVIYMRHDCHICRAEGFSASSRVSIEYGGKELIATLNVVDVEILAVETIGLSDIAWARLGLQQSANVRVTHAPYVASIRAVRKKIYGSTLTEGEIGAIVSDISNHRYSDIEIASFLSACVGERMSLEEIIALTRAMIHSGKCLRWPENPRIFDKHCIGGVPGNRTTPLVAAIVSAAGLIIPKTSSRAITSPAGTADTMATLTNVNLSLSDIRRVVSTTGACLVWGGAVNLSPVDDLLIRIERALDLDGEGQLIASVLSKKIAAGSTDILIDIPLGETAKVRSADDAERLANLFQQVGEALGVHIRSVFSDGSQPVGNGIGPVEEARDLLAVLRREAGAPKDLRERALTLSAELLDMASGDGVEAMRRKAISILDSGQAWTQFLRIVEAQGNIQTLPQAAYTEVINAACSGTITAIDNRRLSRLARLAGAPEDAEAGLRLHAKIGDRLMAGQPLFTLLSASPGERDYALAYYRDNVDMIKLRGTV